MQFSFERDRFERDRLETLTAAIARSPIVMKRRAPRLPGGFGEADAAVLEWIAAEARRLGRGLRLI